MEEYEPVRMLREVRQYTDLYCLRGEIRRNGGGSKEDHKVPGVVRGSEDHVEIQNGDRGSRPCEPAESPERAVVHEETQPVLKIGIRLESLTQHDCHGRTRHEMKNECDGCCSLKTSHVHCSGGL